MKTGFTMIELIFVIVILGVLAAVAIPKFNGVQYDAQIAYERNTIGALRSTISAIHAKSIIKNGDFTAYTDAPNGIGRGAIFIETSEYNYPLALSVEPTVQADNKYHLTELEQLDPGEGINGYVLAVIMSYSSRDNFFTGKTFTSEGVSERCPKTATACRQLIEGPASKKTGISTNEGFYDIYASGAWTYDAIAGVIVYTNQKSDGTKLNILDNSSPDF